jgi:hypothetical protein
LLRSSQGSIVAGGWRTVLPPNCSIKRTQIPLRGLCAAYFKRWASELRRSYSGSKLQA